MERIINSFRKAHPVKQTVIILWIIFFLTGIFSLLYFPTKEVESFLFSIIGTGFSIQTLAIFWGLFVLRVLFFFPMSVLLVLSPIIFGNLWLGILLSGVGQMIGASFGFFLARYYGQEFIETKNSHLMEVVNHKLEKHGILSIVLLRIIPVFPYDLINFASGLSRLRYSCFLGATSLSVWPDCILYGSLGGATQDHTVLIFSLCFALAIFGFLWYLKTHPKFKDFFVMSLKKNIKKIAAAERKLQKKITNQIKKQLSRRKKSRTKKRF
jgi:uncharacterized membrane protein YdjX (TVP38/TMEM64 family)